MRNKSLFLLVACICGTIAAIGVSQWMQAQDKGQGRGPTVAIYVAVANIDKGEEVTGEKIRLEEWPEGKAPPGTSGKAEEVLGKYAKTQFYAGEPLMPVKLTDTNYKVVPRGYNAVAMRASDVNITNMIQPGDPVNVMAYFTKSELIPRSITKTVLMGVRVYALDGDTERRIGDDRPKRVSTIQLLVHKNDLEAWTYANELGKIRLAVGNDADFGTQTTEDGSNIAGQEFLKWLEDHQRAKEEAERLAKEAEQRRSQPPVSPEAVATEHVEEKEEEGFEILKFEAGRIVKYRVVPGKLPVVVEDTGSAPGTEIKNNDPSPTTSQRQDSATSGPLDEPTDEYGYLNGEDSPFFQPKNGQSGF